GELPAFRQEREDSKNNRYKSSDSSSFNTKDSGEGSINLNTTVGTEEENKVEEVRRPRPMGRDQAKRKIKAGSASLASSFDVAELAKMMASEYVMASDPYNTQKKQEMPELLKIKNRELELKAAELEIRRMENRQSDEALYETTTDEAFELFGGRLKLGMSTMDAYTTTLNTWASWVESMIDTDRTRVLFWSFEGSHWSGPNGHTCKDTKMPTFGRSFRSDAHVGTWSDNPKVLILAIVVYLEYVMPGTKSCSRIYKISTLY
ncbi:RNA-directed DNA polymerase, eukaryota, partial [Tanacetum coccineum]